MSVRNLGSLGNVKRHGAASTAIALLNVVIQYHTTSETRFQATFMRLAIVYWARSIIEQSKNPRRFFSESELVAFGGEQLKRLVSAGLELVESNRLDKFRALASSYVLFDSFD